MSSRGEEKRKRHPRKSGSENLKGKEYKMDREEDKKAKEPGGEEIKNSARKFL